MHTIAVVDDRTDVRDLAVRRIERALRDVNLEGTWCVISAAPLPSPELYAVWLVEEEVSVLVLDERLNEGGPNSVHYRGHDILRGLKPRMFDLPVYYLTAVPNDTAVEADGAKVLGIIARTTFLRDPAPWVRDFTREGERYQQRVARKLSRLSELAQGAVKGKSTSEELAEASALRQELQLPFESGALNEETRSRDRSTILGELNREVNKMERAIDVLKRQLKPAKAPKTRVSGRAPRPSPAGRRRRP